MADNGLDMAFTELLRRHGIEESTEPYLLFAALALELKEMREARAKDMERVGKALDRVEAALKPEIIVPAGINGSPK